MRVVMLTNTFTPHVGGVARSVEAFRGELERRGHRVLVVAPEFAERPADERDVVRVPALQRFNGSDFSFPVPAPAHLRDRLDELRPQVVHSHHPFLLGDTALRLAAERGLPIVFTHHTMYERYTHYVPGDSPRMQRAAIELAVGYCNLSTAVIAPSRSVAELLVERGVERPIHVIPTGVDLERFAGGDGARFRRRHGIPATAFVVGHLGRLAPEKNVPLLAAGMARFVAASPDRHALVVGDGPAREALVERFAAGAGERLHLEGQLAPEAVADAYAAMDVFAFASTTETQGMVVTEAMAAGVPVVALDGPGVREVVDESNGRLLAAEGAEDAGALAAALAAVAEAGEKRRAGWIAAARATAAKLALPRTADLLVELYAALAAAESRPAALAESGWERARARLAEEWKIALNLAHALGETLRPEP